MTLYPSYLLVSSRRYRQEQARRLLYVPHDTFRYSFDDRLRQHSQGWKFNPAGTGLPREIVRIKNMSRPEVYRLSPAHSFDMTAPWLKLLQDINPEIDPAAAISILDQGLAYCNTRTNLLDQIRITGGATVEETHREGSRVYIKTILTGNGVPRAADVLADPALWHWVTGVRPDGNINMVLRWDKARTKKIPVRMLNISVEPVYMMADEFLAVSDFVDPQTWRPG